MNSEIVYYYYYRFIVIDTFYSYKLQVGTWNQIAKLWCYARGKRSNNSEHFEWMRFDWVDKTNINHKSRPKVKFHFRFAYLFIRNENKSNTIIMCASRSYQFPNQKQNTTGANFGFYYLIEMMAIKTQKLFKSNVFDDRKKPKEKQNKKWIPKGHPKAYHFHVMCTENFINNEEHTHFMFNNNNV